MSDNKRERKKDILYPLRYVHGLLHETYLKYEKGCSVNKYLKNNDSSQVFIIGTPEHKNMGDSAIVLAEKMFLKRHGYAETSLIELTSNEVHNAFRIVIKYICNSTNGVVIWNGGGNIGNQWISEELLRRRVLERLSKQKIIIFPQTIYYTNTEVGRREEKNSIRYYDRKKNLTIVARERKSYSLMKKLYSHTNVMLIPDIVLSTSGIDFDLKKGNREGILFCTRSDEEKAVNDDVWETLKSEIKSIGRKYKDTDMYSEETVTKDNRRECVRKKLQEFCDAELVITDRLHGMLFSALAETPCIVFSNYNHKVEGTYEWIKHLPYIRYVETVEEAKQAMPELLNLKECVYDNSPLMSYFDKLAEIVR